MLSAKSEKKVDRLRLVAKDMFWLAFAATVLVQPSAVLAQEVQPAQRSQDQAAVSTGVRVADFSTLPQDIADEVVISLPEIQLQGVISVEELDGPLHGVPPLGQLQVEQLDLAVSAELVCL